MLVPRYECDWSAPFLFEAFSFICRTKKGEPQMEKEKKKITYEGREEQLINGNDLQEKTAILSLISGLSLRVRVCEGEILRMQNIILSVEEEESFKKMKERCLRQMKSDSLS
jgi:hypothetical protein